MPLAASRPPQNAQFASDCRRTPQAGFALVIALSLMAFVLVLLLSLTTIIRVETKSAEVSVATQKARQNALLGMQIALGELQRYAGPDQRITAPATTVYPLKDTSNGSGELYDIFRSNATGGPRNTYLTPIERSSFETELQTWWTNKNPRWVGIYDSSLRRDSQVDSDEYGEFDRTQLPHWLISGNAGKLPTDSDYITPDSLTADPATDDDIVWLVNNTSATLSADSSDGLDGRVKAKKVDVLDATGSNSGNYAYWVSDESTKANIAVQGKDPDTLSASEYLDYLQTAQRVGWENIEGFSNSGGTFDPYDDSFARVQTLSQLAIAEPTFQDHPTGTRGPIQKNFHDLTIHSKSLLTNTALGGLKQDLTAFIHSPGASSLSPNTYLLDPSKYSSSDPRFGTGNAGFPNASNNTPKWGKLLSWHNNTGSATQEAVVVPPSDIESGVFPVVTMHKSHIGFSVSDPNDPSDPNYLPSESAYRLNMRYYPVVTLWNPFDAKIASTTYRVELGVPFNIHELNVNYKLSTPATDPADPNIITASDPNEPWVKAELSLSGGTGGSHYGSDLTRAIWDTKDYLRPLQATITTDLEPGELLVFSLSSDVVYDGVGGTHNTPIVLENIYEDNASLQIVSAAPGGVVMPTPFIIDFSATPSFTNIEELTYTANAWNNQFETNELLDLNSSAVDTHDFHNESPYITLFLGNAPLFRNAAGNYNQNNTSNFFAAELAADWDWHQGSKKYEIARLTKWRTLYTDTDFLARAPLSNPNIGGNVWDKSDTIIGLCDFDYLSSIFPDTGDLDVHDTTAENAKRYHRFFANYNLASTTWEFNPLIDGARDLHGTNNGDGFEPANLYSKINYVSSNVGWGANIADSSTDRARGYYFTETIRSTTSQFQQLSHYSVRNVRRIESELLSLGQLSQVGLADLFYQPSSPLGNSEAPLYSDREMLAGITSRNIFTTNSGSSTVPNDSDNHMLDISYLLNESLWDQYYFSTVPQSGIFDLTTDTLPNSRHQFNQENTSDISDARDFDLAASHLFNHGALNINSTSVEAWISLITAFRDLQLSGNGQSNPVESTPIVHSLSPIEAPVSFTENTSTSDTSTYGATSNSNRDIRSVTGGFRYLTDPMIRSLSERIVDEVRLRGPFLSLADFTNRRLVSPEVTADWTTARTQAINTAGAGPIGSNYDPIIGMAGLKGPLQRAIDLSGINGGVNHPGHNLQFDRIYSLEIPTPTSSPASENYPAVKLSDTRWYLDSEHAAGAPVGEHGSLFSHSNGFVSQANLLSMIGAALTPRGDTFLIRTYGDSVSPITGEIIGKAWLEAVVQRIPEYVDSSTAVEAQTATLTGVNDQFGRRFKVISMRYLSEDEI